MAAKRLLWASSLLLVLLQDNASAFRCPPRSQCTCYKSIDPDFEITCPGKGSTALTVELNAYSTGKVVKLQCRPSMAPQDYKLIPRLDSREEVQSFSFSMCPLPDDSLGDVMSQLGIVKARTIFFQTFGRNLSNTLKRHHLKGLESINRLVLSSNGLTDLPADVFFDLKNLTGLNLRSNKIHIHPDLFKYTKKLHFLELGHNDLPVLPSGLFRHLTVLKQLNLWQNSLTNLTSDVFEGLESLEELDLSSNNLQMLPSDVFKHLPNLTLLNMYSNNLSRIPEDIFGGNPNLKVLKLYDNKQDLKELPEKMLSNLTKLSEVRLYRCNIVNIGKSLLWYSTAITNISLEGNMIREIPRELFRDQVNLLDLNLSNNQLQIIPDHAFDSLSKLLNLNLDHNKLTKLSGRIFESLLSLNELSIRHNLLNMIAADTFSFTKNLEYIDMSYNNLTLMEDEGLFLSIQYNEFFGLKSPFQNLNGLRYLNLSHNQITEIFSDWRLSSINLRLLDLTYNNIFKISFSDVHFINSDITVDLRYNNISEIDFINAAQVAGGQDPLQPDAVHSYSQPARLVRVYIENNPIVCECLLYHFIKYLSNELDEQVNALVSVDPGSAVCTAPETLEGWRLKDVKPQLIICPLDDPKSNAEKHCPRDCVCFVRPDDRSLIVNCSVPVLANDLNLPDIDRLNLKYTELHYENRMMQSLSQLSIPSTVFNQITKLYVKGNNISFLSDEDIPRRIEILDLRKNSIGHVNESVSDILSNLTTLREMWISENPIECDCENGVFLSFLQSNFEKIKDLSNVTCSNGQAIRTVTLGELCGTSPAVIAISVMIALAGLIVGIAAALFYKYQQEIKVWLFSKGLCLWWVTEKELDKDKLYDAFISYSHKDEDFVVNKLAAELEGGLRPFKLCLHFRDWVAGEWIPTQIARSVEDSRRTLVVLSPNFLESVWGRMEFRAAHSRALKEGRTRVIIILYGDIGPTDNLDPELQAYLSMNTYVKWGDPWFWDKLRYAMPHPNYNKSLNPAHNVLSKKGFDDRLELIHPTTPSTPPGQNTPPAHQAHTNPLMNHVSSIPNGYNGIKHPNGTITMNGLALKVNGNAKHSDV